MGIFDFFNSNNDREKLSHLKALVALSLADGKLEKAELAAIAAVCQREGLTDADLKKCIDDLEKNISFFIFTLVNHIAGICSYRSSSCGTC